MVPDRGDKAPEPVEEEDTVEVVISARTAGAAAQD